MRVLILAGLTTLILGAFLWLLLQTSWSQRIRRSQKGVLFPPDGQPTLFHVRQLLVDGEKSLAVALYAKIYRVGNREALKQVEALEKFIQKEI